MKLQTQLTFEKQPRNLIDYQSKILLLGSCFSENIGSKLNYFKFQNLQNPFGILFHPKAIEKLVLNAINQKKYTEEDIIENNNIYHSFEAHSELSSLEKGPLLESLNTNIATTNQFLKEASHIIITLGTSWVYRHIATDEIVANCHKIPQKKFLKELLSVDEISESLDTIVQLIKSVNKSSTILFTVSPVRHLKDGFIENTQSKSHLIAAIHQTVNPRENVHYFPSYEIMMDELRDYRFYKEDMIHPNETAINYIWDKFTTIWFSEANFQIMKQVDTIQKGLQHRPFHEKSDEHQDFLKNLNRKIETLQKEIPTISF